MKSVLRAAGLESWPAEEHRIHGEPVVLVRVGGDAARQAWRAARDALPEHWPVLLLDAEYVTEPDYHHDEAPAELIARAADFDLDQYVTWEEWQLGTGDEGYFPDSYDVAGFGEPEALAILPRREPWAAFAYLNPYGWTGSPPEALLAAARRWHDRYRAVPHVVDIASGFLVSRPPTDLADAERLACEHEAIAGLTAGTTLRAYARALMEIDRWCLYNRP